MSSTQSSSTMSSGNSQANCLDPLDAMVDFSEYEQVSYQHSPSISPSAQKAHFTSRSVSNTPSVLPSSQPMLSGPSHNYDMYRQQTGIPKGAIANTLAVNANNMHINQYGFADNYLSGLSPSDDFVDFGTAPRPNFSSPDNNDMDFDSPEGEPAFFYPEQQANEFIDPSAIGASHHGLPAAPVLATQGNNNAQRLYPGMHQHQAALAKAQQQQKQQQQLIQQQQRQNAMGGQPRQQQRPRATTTGSDPIVEEKISQLLNSMRQSSVMSDGDDHSGNGNLSHAQRTRKEEDEMDEDERLLASEEGKKLSSKERRQLRNKVSARAFRSRRKEYIGQLEGEIAQKVNENSDLRSQNRALMEENTRLSDLTRMLLSSPSFSGFLDTLSQNPAAAPMPLQHQPQQRQEQKVRKDVNPYAAPQHMQHQQIGMTMIPEQHMDFSMLAINNENYYQPQVFSVLSLPDTILDAETLSGKPSATSNMVSDVEKVELPIITRAQPVAPVEAAVEVVDEEFDADPAFALFASSPATTITKSEPLDISALIASISAKPIQLELVVEVSVSEDEVSAAMSRIERLAAKLDRMTETLKDLNVGL